MTSASDRARLRPVHANPLVARRSRHRLIALLAIACAVGVAAAAGGSPIANADTAGPSITGITPGTVAAPSSSCSPVTSDSCPVVVFDITGQAFTSASKVHWRGADYPVDWTGDSTHVTVTIPESALSIAEAFLTVDVTLSTGVGATSNPWPVTILGPDVTAAQSAVAGAGATATVSTTRLSATYTRAAAGYGTLTAVDYAAPPDPYYPTDPRYPADPLAPGDPYTPIAVVDLQLRSAGTGDSLVGTFLPPNPVRPTDPYLPPNPVRLAYWTGSAWAWVRSTGGVTPSFAFDHAARTASPASVTFDASSTPQITALGGTIFAVFAARSGPVSLIEAVHEELDRHARSGNKALADKAEDVRDEVGEALERLERGQAGDDDGDSSAPDGVGALGNLEGAVGDLEAMVKDALLETSEGRKLMDKLAEAGMLLADEAIVGATAAGRDQTKIADAETLLAAGDARRDTDRFKDALSKYKDAYAKARGA